MKALTFYLSMSLLLLLLVTVAVSGCRPAREAATSLFGGAPAREAGVSEEPAIGLANPAAVYCADLGYDYEIVSTNQGEVGVCKFPTGETCEEWDFLSGKCGAQHSICAKLGYKLEVRSDGDNPFSVEYAQCVDAKGKVVGSVVELAELGRKAKAGGCETELNEATSKAEFEVFRGEDEVAGDGKGEVILDDEAMLVDEEPEVVLPEEAWAGAVPYQPTLNVATLPSSFDWRNNSGNYMTNVRNQGICGSCWAFAAIGVVEAVLNIINDTRGNAYDLSEQYLVSNCLTGNSCCSGFHYNALNYIKQNGAPDEACLRYVDGNASTGCSCEDGSCDSNCTYSTGGQCSDTQCADRCANWSPRLTRIRDYGLVDSTQSIIKTALVEKGPLAATMRMSGSFRADGVYRCNIDSPPNHGVVIVGYNDAGGYWIVRNSWGPTWHGDGYFHVGYGECSIENDVYYARNDGFYYSFNETANGWVPRSGNWRLFYNRYYGTSGPSSIGYTWATTSYRGTFSNGIYEVRMKRWGCEGCANSIFIRGNPMSLDQYKLWKDLYIFQYSNNGYFIVWKQIGGVQTYLRWWTTHSAINQGGWNTLKVIADATQFKFYINGTLVWAGWDGSLAQGHVGIGMYSASSDDRLLVDYAKLSVLGLGSAAESQDVDVVIEGVEVPGGSEEMSP